MRHFLARFVAGTALALLILAAVRPAAAENVPLHKVPKPVLDAVRARFENARIVRADKDLEDGKLLYEVTIRQQGRNMDVTLTSEGVILLIKTEIAARDLPEPVARALEHRYPKATYKVVEEAVKLEGRQETVAYYEVLLVTAQRKTLEVHVDTEGTVLKETR